ncbi:MAG: cohesin domain-containing protein [bacterium]
MNKKICLVLMITLAACCWPGSYLMSASAQTRAVSINLANASGAPGSLITLPVSLQANGNQVGALSVDIGFNSQMLLNPTARLNPAIAEGTSSNKTLISSTPSTGVVRMAVIPNFSGTSGVGSSTGTIPDGQVATITFSLAASAAPGAKLTLTNSPSSSTPAGAALSTTGQGGEITVSAGTPTWQEICDGRDNNGNGQIDEGLTQTCATACGRGHEVCQNGRWVNCNAPLPQTEVCDGKDNDCDNQIDEGVMNTYYPDRDGDGYGQSAGSRQACSPPSGYVANSLDCDDADSTVHPRAPEIPCNGKDDDCQGGDDTVHCESIPAGGCTEDDSGAIDIQGASGRPGEEVTIAVRVKYAPGSISAFGFDVLFDESVLEYSGYARGDLTTSFDLFEVNLIDSGRVRIGGLTDSSLPQGANGSLVLLKFIVISDPEEECYPLELDDLLDDVAHYFSASRGCFCIGLSCTGDQNGDGKITPQDALVVFRCYLGIGECPPCTDVDGNGQTTPSDALCLFKAYLGQPSCLDD